MMTLHTKLAGTPLSPCSPGSRGGGGCSAPALRSCESVPRRSALGQRLALKVIGVSLLALGLGTAASRAQTTPPTCEATDVAITGITPAPSDIPALLADCTALLAIEDPLKGTGGTLDWAKTLSMADWTGISLSDNNSRVTRIDLSTRNPKLNGSIPDLSALTALEIVDLSNNRLRGAIPDLSALTALEIVDLSDNQLTGAIPDPSALTALEILDLSDNQLTGTIPDPSALTALQALRLNDNRLIGSIPSLSMLTKLKHLNVSGMNLTGAIRELTGLVELERFDVSENKLTGEIPALTGLAELEAFVAHDNALTGTIPDLSGLTKLARLELGNSLRAKRGIGNNLDGPIPSLGGLSALEILSIPDARLDGPIPNLSDLGALTHLHLHNNRLTGAPPPTLANLSSLEELLLQTNLLNGGLPGLGALTSMEKLHLASNGITGGMPLWLDSLTSLEELSLCFTDIDPSGILPFMTEQRRAAGDLNLFGCLRIDEAEVQGMEGESVTFNVTHSSWPVRGRHGLFVKYRTVDVTAGPLDYLSTSDSSLAIPAAGSNGFMKTAALAVPAFADADDEEFHETFRVELVEAYELATAGAPQGTNPSDALPKDASWTATGTILGTGPPPPPGTGPSPDPDPDPDPGPGPAPGPAPDPDPEPDPEPDPDPGPDPAACDRLVAPYWRGAGGIAVQPKNGRSAVFRHSCRGAQTTETLYANEAGLIVQLLSRDACTDDAGKEISTEVSVEGVEDGGWYWIDGDRNSAVAPLLCEVQLGGAQAAVPAGVSTDVTADATLFEHHASRLLGIVPHLQAPASGACSAYAAPYWKGAGGLVVSATDGESAQLTNTCGGVSKTLTLKADDAGLIVQLLGEGDSDASSCTDGAGKVLRSDLSIAGVEPGGWYWLNGARNSAVAPLACADQLGGSKATVPAGVDADATASGTLFEHHVAKLIGIVPHLRRE